MNNLRRKVLSWETNVREAKTGGLVGGEGGHVLESSPRRVVRRERGDRKPAGPRPPTNAAAAGEGAARQPFPTGAPAARPSERVT